MGSLPWLLVAHPEVKDAFVTSPCIALCTDIDECDSDNGVNVCGDEGICSETSDGSTASTGTYFCNCSSGYEGGQETNCSGQTETNWQSEGS